MNRWNIYKIYICLLVVFLICISAVVYKKFLKNGEVIVSPLPDFLTVFANKEVSTLDLWIPVFKILKNDSSDSFPIISAESALVYDLTADKIIFEKNPKEKLPMASLTKIMTAIIALESPKKESYVVLKHDLVGENTMGLTSGETLSLEDLIYGLILPSGNDAAEVLAGNYLGGRKNFIRAMNDKAKSLGLSNTNFTNPSGLEGDGRQYTTAYDLLVLTKYALRFPLFRKVAASVEHHIPYTSSHKEFYLFNETNLLTSYPGVKGVKTGFTEEAGLCLVTHLDYGGHEIIGIILGSEHRREEMKELLDYSLKIQGITPPVHS